MSLVGTKAAVVSLGMSCQTTLQIDDHAAVIAHALGDVTLKPSSMLFDNIVCHPASATMLLQTDRFFPASKDELELLRGALWTENKVYFRHECTLRKSRPIEYLTGKVNLARGHRDLVGKFTHLAEKFRSLAKVERLIFVISNTQNDLAEYRDEAGIDSMVSMEEVEALSDACDRYFVRPCEYIFVTYPNLRTGTTSRRGLSVFELKPDSSEWGGDHAQWKALWEDYFSATPVPFLKDLASA